MLPYFVTPINFRVASVFYQTNVSDLQNSSISTRIIYMKQWLGRTMVLLVAIVASGGLFVGIAYADSLKSSHYEFINTDIGGGGLIPSSSPNYQSVESVGDSAIGHTSSTSYQTQAGSQTTKDPTLSLAITNGNASFNTLFSPAAPSTATAKFSVIDYTSYGYAVQLVGNTPSNGNHSIPAMSDGSGGPTTSTPGYEQFGINLVKNTSPNVGANPDRGQFGVDSSYANPTSNFDVPDNFYYSSGDSVAQSTKSSGEIDYTISYVVNVSSLTPGGQYTSDESIICTGTY